MTLTLPTAKIKPTTDLAKQSILLYGAPKLGKCLAGNSVLYDPTTGQPVALEDLVASKEGAVLSMGMAGIIKSADPTDYIDNGEAILYRITTQSGRTIDATAEHPFLTREGWAPLSTLKDNDKVGVVAEYSSLFGTVRTEPEFLKVLAYLLADGSLGGTSPVFTKVDEEVREDFKQAVETIGDDFLEFNNDQGIPQVRVKGGRIGRNNVLRFIREHGIDGLRSAEKFIPDFVFGLQRERMALFLNRLFSCDGSVEKKRVSYSSKSIRMVKQVQHLLSWFTGKWNFPPLS